jgi:hypothetical protein
MSFATPNRDILDQSLGIAGISSEAAHIHIVSAREDKPWKLRELPTWTATSFEFATISAAVPETKKGRLSSPRGGKPA